MEINEAIFRPPLGAGIHAAGGGSKAIRRLIEAAVHAPSAVNQRPWMFTVVREKAVLDNLSRAAKVHMLATMSPGALAAENLMLAAHDVGLGTVGSALPKASSIRLREKPARPSGRFGPRGADHRRPPQGRSI